MSQYFSPFRIDEASTATNTVKYQTVALTAGAVSSSTAVTARRIAITNGASPVFVAFGATPVVSTSTGFQIPANTCMVFNFKIGDKVAAVSASNSAISILDLD
jgi:hypothetical protein